MYKLWHKLFGWDYIYWEEPWASGICRIHIDGEGNPYFYKYKSIKVLNWIKETEYIRWLTCNREKYNV